MYVCVYMYANIICDYFDFFVYHMYVCMYVCTYVRIYVNMYVFVYTLDVLLDT